MAWDDDDDLFADDDIFTNTNTTAVVSNPAPTRNNVDDSFDQAPALEARTTNEQTGGSRGVNEHPMREESEANTSMNRGQLSQRQKILKAAKKKEKKLEAIIAKKDEQLQEQAQHFEDFRVSMTKLYDEQTEDAKKMRSSRDKAMKQCDKQKKKLDELEHKYNQLAANPDLNVDNFALLDRLKDAPPRREDLYASKIKKKLLTILISTIYMYLSFSFCFVRSGETRDLCDEIATLKEQLNAVEQELKDVKNEHEQEVSDLKIQHTSNVADLEAKHQTHLIDAQKSSGGNGSISPAEKDSIVAECEKEKQALKEKFVREKQELIDNHQQEKNTLADAHTEDRQRLIQLHADEKQALLDAHEQDRTNVKLQHAEDRLQSENNIHELNEQIRVLNSENAALSHRNDILSSDLAELRSIQLEKTTDHDLRQEMEATRNEFDALRQECGENAAQRDDLQDQLDDLQARYDDLKQNNEQALDLMEKAALQKNELAADYAAQDEEIDRLAQESLQKTNQIAELQSRIRQLESSSRPTGANVPLPDDDNTFSPSPSPQRDDAALQIKFLRDQLEKQKAEAETLREENAELNKLLDTDAEVVFQQSQLTPSQTPPRRTQSSSPQRVVTDRSKLENENRKLREEVQKLKEAEEMITNEGGPKAALYLAKRDCHEYAEEVEELQGKNNRLRDQCMEFRNEIKLLKTQQAEGPTPLGCYLAQHGPRELFEQFGSFMSMHDAQKEVLQRMIQAKDKFGSMLLKEQASHKNTKHNFQIYKDEKQRVITGLRKTIDALKSEAADLEFDMQGLQISHDVATKFLNNQITSLKSDLENHPYTNDDYEDLKSAKELVEIDLRHTKKALDTIQASFEDECALTQLLQENCDELEAQLAAERETSQHNKECYEKKDNDFNIVFENQEKLKQTKETLESHRENLSKQLIEQNNAREEITKKYHELSAQHTSLTQSNADNASKLQQLESEHASNLATAQQAAAQKEQELASELAQLQESHGQLQQQVDNHAASHAEKDQQVLDLQSQTAQHEEHKQQLQSQLEQAQAERGQWEAQATTNEQNRAAWEERANFHEEACKQASSDLEQSNSKITELEQQLHDLQTRSPSPPDTSEFDQQIASLNEQLTAKQQEVEQAQAALSSHQEAASSAQAEVARLNTAHQELQATHAAQTEQLQAELDNLRSSHQDLQNSQAENATVATDLAARDQQIANLTQELESERADKQQKMDHAAANFTATHEAHQAEVDQLNAQLEQERKLAADHAEYTHKIKTHMDENLLPENDMLKQQIAQLQQGASGVEQLQQQNAELQQQIVQLQQGASGAEQLQTHIDNVLTPQITQLTEQNQQLTIQINTLQQSASGSEADFKNQIAILTQQNQEALSAAQRQQEEAIAVVTQQSQNDLHVKDQELSILQQQLNELNQRVQAGESSASILQEEQQKAGEYQQQIDTLHQQQAAEAQRHQEELDRLKEEHQEELQDINDDAENKIKRMQDKHAQELSHHEQTQYISNV